MLHWVQNNRINEPVHIPLTFMVMFPEPQMDLLQSIFLCRPHSMPYGTFPGLSTPCGSQMYSAFVLPHCKKNNVGTGTRIPYCLSQGILLTALLLYRLIPVRSCVYWRYAGYNAYKTQILHKQKEHPSSPQDSNKKAT